MIAIITGSRRWEGVLAQDRVQAILESLYLFSFALDQKLTIRHGDCPTGADAIADRWARRRLDEGVIVQAYQAEWARYGKSAGPRRNLAMIDAGADVTIGFLRPDSLGTRNCLALSRHAKIPAFEVHWDPLWPEPGGTQ